MDLELLEKDGKFSYVKKVVVKEVSVKEVKEVRNGIRRPKAGGKCREVWDALDAGVAITVKGIVEYAKGNGIEVNTAKTQFYVWLKFNKRSAVW